MVQAELADVAMGIAGGSPDGLLARGVPGGLVAGGMGV